MCNFYLVINKLFKPLAKISQHVENAHHNFQNIPREYARTLETAKFSLHWRQKCARVPHHVDQNRHEKIFGLDVHYGPQPSKQEKMCEGACVHVVEGKNKATEIHGIGQRHEQTERLQEESSV